MEVTDVASQSQVTKNYKYMGYYAITSTWKVLEFLTDSDVVWSTLEFNSACFTSHLLCLKA